MRLQFIALALLAVTGLASVSAAQVRTADPIKPGLRRAEFPRTVKITD